jgi:AraC family transcriptional activator of tynA and feaB
MHLRDEGGDYVDLAGVPVADREDRLAELVSTTHVDMAVRLGPEASAASFQAWVHRRWLEDLALVEVGVDPCSGMRGKRRAARTDELYLGVMVLQRGMETVALDDITSDLHPGDAVVWRSDQPPSSRCMCPSSSALSSSRCLRWLK